MSIDLNRLLRERERRRRQGYVWIAWGVAAIMVWAVVSMMLLGAF